MPVILVLLAAVLLAISVLVGAARRSEYSHRRHTISELGERGSVFEGAFSWGIFLPTGLLLAAAGLMTLNSDPPAAALALCIAAGYLSAAVFPCDVGSPLGGSWRQAWHNIGGAVQYLGGALSLMLVAETDGPAFRFAGMGVGAIAILISFPGPVRGALQRAAEVLLFSGLVAALLRT
ncbi:MAG: DUF998 domain-containing protein [Woeseiaceae bacterium]|nr:DUF998 domain-containing protein [Woeseiaceae bacterium]